MGKFYNVPDIPCPGTVDKSPPFNILHLPLPHPTPPCILFVSARVCHTRGTVGAPVVLPMGYIQKKYIHKYAKILATYILPKTKYTSLHLW